MRAVGLVAIFLVALAGFLAAGAPLSLALDLAHARDKGIGYAEASGTVWDGVVHGVHVAGQPVGDVELTVAPASLLRGRLAVTFAARGAVRADGVARIAPNGAFELARTTVVMNTRDLARLHPDLAARGGEVFVRLEEAAFDGRRACVRAQGVLQSDVLARGARDTRWRGPALEGGIRCEDGVVLVEVEGENAGADVRVFAALSPRGGARVTADVATESPDLAAALAYYGFEETAEGYTYAYQSGQGGRS